MHSGIKGAVVGRGGFITVAHSLGVGSCEASGYSFKSESITGSSRVLDKNIRD